ncbi:YciI family protein [Cellulomonas sp. ICMP 17802]|uniref:YciI family protein n=1 Tax=Cellulomonas sp. ICMP 17802 TaxID=3239199 RepID=UPI00351BA4B0
MKYVILIHANPKPWAHPTSRFTPEGRAVPADEQAEMDRQFDTLLTELSQSGELVTAEALADPRESTVYRWRSGGSLASEGPFAETQEQLAGFFLIDCASRERAEQVAAQFAGPGSPAELRPAYVWG